MNTRQTGQPDRIDLNDKAKCETWVRKLNTSHEDLRKAVGAVGDDPKAVEEHLRELAKNQQGGRGSM